MSHFRSRCPRGSGCLQLTRSNKTTRVSTVRSISPHLTQTRSATRGECGGGLPSGALQSMQLKLSRGGAMPWVPSNPNHREDLFCAGSGDPLGSSGVATSSSIALRGMIFGHHCTTSQRISRSRSTPGREGIRTKCEREESRDVCQGPDAVYGFERLTGGCTHSRKKDVQTPAGQRLVGNSIRLTSARCRSNFKSY